MAISKLFEKIDINGMVCPNRFVRSATYLCDAAKEGACTPTLIEIMRQLAEGGVGLIVAGASYVRQDGQSLPMMMGIYDDSLIEGYRRLTKEVHRYDSRIALQLNHGGKMAMQRLTGRPPMAPSIVDYGKPTNHVMTINEIREIVRDFGMAAKRARRAGFDAVQLHGAHGYLVGQFLSPALNKRRDEYGGSLENRARFLLEVIREIRDAVGDDYPVMVKISAKDYLTGGIEVEESIQVGSWLQEEGIDAIELSGGTIDCMPNINRNVSRLGITSEEKEAYFQEAARAFKEKNSVHLTLVGGIRSFQVAEKLVADGVADSISMSRPFIREPGIIKRWESGYLTKATCLSDNQCMIKAEPEKQIICVVEQQKQKRLTQKEVEQ